MSQPRKSLKNQTLCTVQSCLIPAELQRKVSSNSRNLWMLRIVGMECLLNLPVSRRWITLKPCERATTNIVPLCRSISPSTSHRPISCQNALYALFIGLAKTCSFFDENLVQACATKVGSVQNTCSKQCEKKHVQNTILF